MATIFGTDKTRETVFGTASGDTIYGGPFNHPLGSGVDVIHAGAGDDTVHGGDGEDVLYGGNGNDNLYDYQRLHHGGIEIDHLYGGSGIDTLFSLGPDRLDGGGGDQDMAVLDRFEFRGRLTLSLSDPSVSQTLSDGTTLVNIERLDFRGGGAASNITGGSLDDTILLPGTGSVANGAGGNDHLIGYANRLNGGEGHDSLTGYGGTTMNGGSGDDSFLSVAQGSANHMNGGIGVDVLRLDCSLLYKSVSVDLSKPAVKQTLSDGSTIVDIERLEFTGSTRDDTAVGGLLNDTLDGDLGADTLRGGGGNDLLYSRHHAGADHHAGHFGSGSPSDPFRWQHNRRS